MKSTHQHEGRDDPSEGLGEDDGNVDGRGLGAGRRRDDGEHDEEGAAAELREEGLRKRVGGSSSGVRARGGGQPVTEAFVSTRVDFSLGKDISSNRLEAMVPLPLQCSAQHDRRQERFGECLVAAVPGL